jgi:hypothetical protein
MGFKSVEATEKEISWLSAKLATLFHCVWGSLAEVSLLISRVGLPSYTWGNQVIPGDTRCHLVDGWQVEVCRPMSHVICRHLRQHGPQDNRWTSHSLGSKSYMESWRLPKDLRIVVTS